MQVDEEGQATTDEGSGTRCVDGQGSQVMEEGWKMSMRGPQEQGKRP